MADQGLRGRGMLRMVDVAGFWITIGGWRYTVLTQKSDIWDLKQSVIVAFSRSAMRAEPQFALACLRLYECHMKSLRP